MTATRAQTRSASTVPGGVAIAGDESDTTTTGRADAAFHEIGEPL